MRDVSNKVTIIGAGSVGATIAYTLVTGGVASDIVMIDIKGAKSLGEALDIRQGIPFCSPSKIHAGSYQDAKDSDIVILTSGVARMPGQSRLDLAQTNVNITKSIIPEIMKYAPDAIYIIVSNPVDILTYQFSKTTGFVDGRVFGSGTILDTARLRSRLSEYYNISQSNVHAYVFGEHGDSSFVPWSLANIANIEIDSYAASISRNIGSAPELIHEEVETYIRQSGGKIIERKGATFYAVAASVCHICRSIFGGADTPMTVSTLLNGEYGIHDVALSILTVVGRTGIKDKLLAPLTLEEEAKLRYSAESLKQAISQIQF